MTGGHQHGDSRHHRHLVPRHAQDVAKERGVEGLGEAPVAADERHADGKARRRDDADGRVGADACASRRLVDEHRRQEAPQPGAEVEIPLHDKGDDRAAEDGVRQAVADVAHAAQDDVDAQQPAQRAGQHGHRDAGAKELILEGFNQPLHAAPPS